MKKQRQLSDQKFMMHTFDDKLGKLVPQEFDIETQRDRAVEAYKKHNPGGRVWLTMKRRTI